MLDRLRSDPMVAGFVWRALLFGFALLMWLALRSEDDDHEWWGTFMVRIKMSPDETSAVESSRTAFKWLTLIMFVVCLWHTGAFFYRSNPFLAKTVETTGEKVPELPRGYGAGGGGRLIPGQTPPSGPPSAPGAEGGKGKQGGLKGRMKDAESD